MIVAIHQPNFFPWLGYFNKMAMSETFVVLDHVEGRWWSTWLTRNRVLSADQPKWLTLPVDRSGHGPVPVTGVRVQWDNRLAAGTLRVIEANYAKHPHFDEVFDLMRRAYARRPEHIAELNLSVIEELRRRFGLEHELVRSSDLLRVQPELQHLHGNDLLVAICRLVGADEYVAGEGCLGYIDPPAFESAGIEFWFQRYVHPEYTQKGTDAFVSRLSVLDALFNVGFDGARELIEGDARERVL
jgi:hypothetical protein